MSYAAAPSFWVFWIFHNALLLTIIFSFIAEKWLKPAPPRLVIKSAILQSLLLTVLFLAVTLIIQRPIFSMLAVCIFLIILTGVSNAKFIVLKEPMVFSDITMFSQAFKHPRLYFPFLGLIPLIIMPLLIIGLIYIVLKLEPAMAITWHRFLITLFAITVCLFLARHIAKDLKLSQEPAIDNRDFGLINSLFTYNVQARSKEHQEYITSALLASPFFSAHVANKTAKNELKKTPPHFLPTFSKQSAENIIVIQSESFFDARRLDPSIKRDVLNNYDNCLKDSSQFGKLKVPAWGANTMRTEFSFLTGLKYEEMGLYRFYPYQYLHKMPIVSLAKLLQDQGYHCVCIHPHSSAFFGRDRIFPQMGFDEFIDIQSFDSNQTFGPYISDQAVTDKILEISKKYADKSVFIFAITMENHGPLHLEKTTQKEQESYFSEVPLEKINDLTVYLRHLKNADEMIEQLTSHYQQTDKPSTLCFYGDHIPSMPEIYQALNYKNDDSDYFIWNNQNIENAPENQTISVENLAETLLKTSNNLTL